MIYEKPNRKWVLDKLSSIDLIGDIAQFMMRFVIVNHQLCVLRRAFHTNISEQTHGERKQRKRNHWDDLTITEPSSRAFKLNSNARHDHTRFLVRRSYMESLILHKIKRMSVENITAPCDGGKCVMTVIQEKIQKTEDSALLKCGGSSIWYVYF